MKVLKMVNRNFNDNYKTFRSLAKEFLIDCELCWYGVYNESDYGVFDYALTVLEGFANILGLGIFVFSRDKFQFSTTTDKIFEKIAHYGKSFIFNFYIQRVFCKY